MPSTCFNCDREAVKSGYCEPCWKMKTSSGSKGKSASWGIDLIAESFCRSYGCDINNLDVGYMAYDSALERYWRYVDAKGNTPSGKNYLGCSWRPFPVKKIIRELVKHVRAVDKGTHLDPTRLKAIAAMCLHYCPEWESGIKDRYISFSDTLIDPDTMEKFPHHPKMKSTINFDIPFDSIKDAECPMFDRFMEDICKDRNGTVRPLMSRQIMESIAYLISNKNFHKEFFYVGPGGNGKSVLLHVIRNILTPERCSSLTIDQLEGFNLAGLLGMKANIVDEDESENSEGTVWKRVVDGTPIEIREIYGEPRTVCYTVKGIRGCNSVPTFKSFSGSAMMRRIRAISFDAVIPKEKIIDDLGQKIVDNGELPAILWKALETLKELNANNFDFTVTQESVDVLDGMEAASSPMAHYLKSNWKIGDKPVPCKELYDNYVNWSRQNNHGVGSSTKFGKKCTELFGKSVILTLSDGIRARGYCLERIEPESVKLDRQQGKMELTNGEQVDF